MLQDIGTLATLSDSGKGASKLGDLQAAAVYIQGPEIRWVGRTSDLPAAYQKARHCPAGLCCAGCSPATSADNAVQADKVLSLPDHVVIPGLVNTHHHMFQTLTRCIAQVRLSMLKFRCAWPQQAPDAS